ncbi:MAG: helix-turn-helix domain-containing protein [Clostridia bacterium]|nr:helix-turn-helix domain-containing protein [Clostridia bacterium]
MKAEFGIKRENNNRLFYKSWTNDKGVYHFHSQIELYFVDDGEMEVVVNDRRAMLKKGEMSVALSFNPHGYRTPQSSASSALIIPTYLCEEFVLATRDKRVASPFIRDRGEVERIKGYYELIKREDTGEIERLGYIYVILGIVMKNLSFETVGDTMDAELCSKILIYINENYKNNITPASVSKHFGYSQSYISRYFKKSFGATLNKYLTVIRLKNVVLLMHEKKHNITYCAMEGGFSSMRTFYRAFYEEFGCPPKEYMKRLTEI